MVCEVVLQTLYHNSLPLSSLTLNTMISGPQIRNHQDKNKDMRKISLSKVCSLGGITQALVLRMSRKKEKAGCTVHAWRGKEVDHAFKSSAGYIGSSSPTGAV